MRKGLIVFGLTVAVGFLGMLSMGVVNAFSSENNNDFIVLNFSQHG